MTTAAKNPRALGTDPVGALLIRYSLPAIAAMVVVSLYNIIDSIFIGHGVGALAISGLAVTFPIMNLTFAFGLLVGIGGASISSIRLGQQDSAGAANVLGNVLILAIINGLGFGLVALAVLEPVLILFGASPQTLPYAREFMQIILLGLPVTYTMFNLNHVMRATGYPHKAMLSVMLTVGVNVILAPVFIFVLHWGIRGAAIATVLSQCSGLIWVLRHFLSPHSAVYFQSGMYRLRLPIVKSIFSIGMSPFLFNICACLVVVLINTGLTRYGGDMAIGAFGISNRILILFVMIVVGLTQGMQPIIGYNYGAQQMPRVLRTLRYGMITGAAVTTIGFLVAELAPGFIARMFTDDEELISIAIRALRICTLAFPIVGCQIVIGNFFQSLGRAKISIFLALSRQLLLLIPFLLILPPFWGQDGIWYSLPMSDALSFILAVAVLILFRKELKHNHHIRHHTPTV